MANERKPKAPPKRKPRRKTPPKKSGETPNPNGKPNRRRLATTTAASGTGPTGSAPHPATLTDPAPSAGTEETLDDVDRFFRDATLGGDPKPDGAAAVRVPWRAPAFDPALVAQLCAFPFAYWARVSKRPEYALNSEEKDLLGSATAKLIDKHMPGAIEQWQEETLLLFAVVVIMAPRMLAKPNAKPDRADPGQEGIGKNDPRSVFDEFFPPEDRT